MGLFDKIKQAASTEDSVVAAQNSTLDANSLMQILGNPTGMSFETTHLVNELAAVAQNGTLDANSLMQILGNPTGMSPETIHLVNELAAVAQNGTLDSNSLIQILVREVGIPPESRVNTGYEVKAGWEANDSKTHTGSDEVVPGARLDSEASYNAKFFAGAYSKGEAEAEWNSEEAHLHVQERTMVGAEANVDADYKGTLHIEGINYQPGAEVQGHANAFAGAETQGRGDLDISSKGADGSLGVEAFAGAKAEAGGSQAFSIDGHDFARGEGGVDARAGIGAEFNADAGYHDGQIEYGVDMGAALGVGAGYHYSGSVDAPGIVTHPDAVWESAVQEVSSYVPEVPSFSTDPNTYTDHAAHYVVQQVQDYVPPMPEEVRHAAEIVSDPGSALEDLGHSLFG